MVNEVTDSYPAVSGEDVNTSDGGIHDCNRRALGCKELEAQ